MENFRQWVYGHNTRDKGRYVLSLIGVIIYFFLFDLFLCNMAGWEGIWLGLLVAVASFDVGRYCINRFLYVSGGDAFDGHQAISSVIRFHAFDVGEYFAGMRKILYIPVLEIVLCVILSVGATVFDGEDSIASVAVVLVVGLLAVFMVYLPCLLKKRQLQRELAEGTDSAASTCIKVFSGIFGLIEILGGVVGYIVAVFFLWIFLCAALEPAIDETQILYRSYNDFHAILFFILALGTFVVGEIQYNKKRFRKVMFILSGVCFVVGGIMTYVQQQRYTELTEQQFRIYDFGLTREYDLQEVESFRIYEDNIMESIQLSLVFSDGRTYKVIGSVSSSSELCEQKYYSDYNLVEDYARKLLEQGAQGTLEDREALGEYAGELHEEVEEAWKEILKLMEEETGKTT